MQVAQSRRQAYDSLGRRTEVPDLRRFVRALVQADQYGVAIADVLRTQASEMRMKRRQRAEEKAMQSALPPTRVTGSGWAGEEGQETWRSTS
jgi:tight adherence protein C